ncbi:glycine betaine ABC transporter substrate-binding protein [Gulosibacter sp. 10]|uniref:glycine betaine ABC transporter substrate-binding protein n=1 Tax=Gulosibacter sp. 10 TaxID=1255570 RepID=UPI00097F1F97|nr:glycine betaine ABC transporter substrate-binding protein [Gulosibacter sp. 10]SJM62536.1 Glycine betaine ABC transport system, glycine betaine-binding protein OpuAC [Gulosibacter sp. 10]
MWKKALAGVASLGLLASVAGCAEAGDDGDTITFFEVPGFDDTEAMTALWTVLLEEQGITLETTSIDLAAGFTGIADGSVDGYVNAWLPSTHEQVLANYKEDVVIVDEDGEGYFHENENVLVVPEYVEHDTIEEALADPELFGGEIIGIEDGSGLMTMLPDTIAAYDATDDFEVVSGSTPAMLTSLQGAIDDQEPILVTLWNPHWAFAEMDLKVLEDNKDGWPEPDGSYFVVSKEFDESHPEIVEWFANSQVTQEEYSTLMHAVSQAETPVDGARTWLEDESNRATVDSWFA